MKKISKYAFGASVLAASLALANTAIAQEVTLRSPDGSLDMTGEFVALQNNSYIIKTAIGEMRVAADSVQCTGAGCPVLSVASDADIVIGGSDTVGLGLMPLLLEGFAASEDAIADIQATAEQDTIVASLMGDQGFGEELQSIKVISTTSGTGFSQLLESDISLGMSSRRITPDEARALRGAGAGNMVSPSQEHIIAVDSLIVVSHPANPIDSLTTEEVRQIFSGQITNWSQVGGADLPITVVGRPDGSGTRSVFESRLYGDAPAVLASTAVIAQSNEDASAMVNEDESAISFVSFAFQRGANAITLVNECGIAMTPDAFSARTEEYALQRRLYLYSREDTINEDSQKFVDFATSTGADSLIGKAGFIGFAVDRRAQPLDGARARTLLDASVSDYEAGYMREMLGQMVDYDRLSTTFRFPTGSSQLDARGRIDKERLISFLEGQPAGTEVLLVGFTDTVGQFDGNLALSRQRAELIASEIAAVASDSLSNISINAVGFGELAPTACNDTDDGRRINRRVEVWIKKAA